MRPSAANRALVRAYPEAVAARFGASAAWARALTAGTNVPDVLGWVWLDPTHGLTPLRGRR